MLEEGCILKWLTSGSDNTLYTIVEVSPDTETYTLEWYDGVNNYSIMEMDIVHLGITTGKVDVVGFSDKLSPIKFMKPHYFNLKRKKRAPENSNPYTTPRAFIWLK